MLPGRRELLDLPPPLAQETGGARGARQRQEVEHVVDRASIAASDAELVTAPHADEQVPTPLERERAARHQEIERLEALAEAVTEIDVVLQRRPGRLLGAEE